MFALAFLLQIAAPATCVADSTAPALDHTIIAVHDLAAATNAFRRAGFKIKAGRLHANGLLNQHIKFRDGSEIELMTIRGTAGDDMARRYQRLLDAGDGGAYVALKTRSMDVVERRARSLGIGTRRSSSGAWQFLGFADTSSAAGVFFSSGNFTVQDADSIFRHAMDADELSEVWLEGGTQLHALLRALGAAPCGRARAQNGVSGERYPLARGSLVVVPQRTGVRPRVLGAVLRTRNTNGFISPIPQYWIRFIARAEP